MAVTASLDRESDVVRATRGPGRWLRPVLGIAISGAFLYLVLSRLSLREVGATLRQADLRILPLAVVSLACGYAARITRWAVMLRTSAPRLRWREAAAPFLISIAANNVLPLRIGDVLRIFAFRGQTGLEPSRIAGTLLVERLLDLVVLLALFAALLTQVPAAGPLAGIVGIGKLAAIAGVVAAAAVFSLPTFDRLVIEPLRASSRLGHRPLLLKALEFEGKLSQTIAAIGRPSRLAGLMLLSLLVWAFEGGLFMITLSAFHADTVVAPGLFALSVATLATLVPSSPGYIGTFHFFAIQALLIFGFGENLAAAFAITAHLLLWLPTTLAGLVAFCWTFLRPPTAPAHSEPLRPR